VAKTLRFLAGYFAGRQADKPVTSPGAMSQVAMSQVIVVDASSPDGTAQQIQAAYPQVTVLSVPDDHFWAAATNAGVKFALAAGFDYLFTVNDDAVLPPDHLAQMLTLAQRHQVKILGNRINYLSNREQVWSLGTYTRWGSADFLRVAYCNQPLSEVPDALLSQEIVAVDALPGNGVLIHRSVFEQIGLYQDTYLPHYHADSEWVMRAQQQGIGAFIAPGLCLYNDFDEAQKQPFKPERPGITQKLAQYSGVFLSKKSHLFAPAVLYILARYCPTRLKLATVFALGKRLLGSSYV
jgi:GT2 family glycosyltransferase